MYFFIDKDNDNDNQLDILSNDIYTMPKSSSQFLISFSYFQIPHQETRQGIEHDHIASESAGWMCGGIA